MQIVNNIFLYLNLEIAFAIPASNKWKIETDNSAANKLNKAVAPHVTPSDFDIFHFRNFASNASLREKENTLHHTFETQFKTLFKWLVLDLNNKFIKYLPRNCMWHGSDILAALPLFIFLWKPRFTLVHVYLLLELLFSINVIYCDG